MDCLINKNYTNQCDLQVGGVQKIWIANWIEGIICETEGCYVTSVDLYGMKFYEIEANPQTVKVQTQQTEAGNAGANYERATITMQTTFSCDLLKDELTFRTSRFVVIIKDENNSVYMYGAKTGLKVSQYDHNIDNAKSGGNYLSITFDGKADTKRLYDENVIPTERPTTDPDWVEVSRACSQVEYPSGAMGNDGYLAIVYEDRNENSPTYGETREERIPSGLCAIPDTQPNWSEITSACVVDDEGQNTGVLRIQEEDTNIYSDTYGATRETDVENAKTCPAPVVQGYLVTDSTQEVMGVYGTHNDALQRDLYRLGIAKNEHFTLFEDVVGVSEIVAKNNRSQFSARTFNELEYFTDLQRIGEYGFAGCPVSSIKFPPNLVEIGEKAFNGCSSLQSVDFGESKVETMGKQCFLNCSKITTVVLSPNQKYLGSYAFANCVSITSVTFTASLETIADHAFSYCTKLVGADLSMCEKVKTLSNGLFEYCSDLAVVSLPPYLEKIETCALSKCNLSALSLPETIRTIERIGVSMNAKLRNITNFDKLTTIGWRAFKGCPLLETVVFPPHDAIPHSGYGNDGYAVFEDSTIREARFPSGESGKWMADTDFFFNCTIVSHN